MRPSFARRAVALVATAIVSAGLVAGCSSSDDNSDDKNKGKNSSDKSSSTPSVLQVDLTEPLTDETFTVGDNDTVTVGVLGLEFDGELQVLHMVFTPHFTSRSRSDNISLSQMLTGDRYSSAALTPRLVDRKNLKVYYAVDDFKTGGKTETVNGHPLYVYAVFAAPEDGNRIFEVRITDAWTPFVDVESVEK
ncbi:MAG: hypothetical protein FWH11_08760 [Micrococcales bacterium]|nr:hypothetical protein [Micrococcales bacterium]